MSFYGRPMEQPLYFYRQHCAQRKPPVFNLLRNRFWFSFRPAGATRCTDGGEIWHGGGAFGVGPQKLTFLLRFDQNVEYKCPARAIPCAIFTKVCTSFQDALAVKTWLDLLEGLWTYAGFKLMGSGYPKFSAPPSGETMRQTQKVSEGQECTRGSLSPCQVWWGSDFTRRWGGQKR